jgi:adenosine deaminase
MRTPNVSWLERIPKAELHLHLEGAIPHDLLWQLVQKYGGDSTVPNRAALDQWLRYRDFPHFIETWKWKNQFLREYADFTAIASAMAADLKRQNIRYAEVFYAPANFVPRGLQIQLLTEAIRRGLDSVQGIEIALVVDLVRDRGPAEAMRTLAQVAEARKFGVIGIGMGGSEHQYPPEPFALVYEAARRHGFHTSAHAGEAAGPASIWGAIDALAVERIGHGTRAQEDERLLERLTASKIPLEMCPLSNVCTGVTADIGESPIRRYFDRGIVVTVNTDDPKMFGNTLAEEYQALHQHLGFSRDDIRQLVLQSIRSSWLAPDRKLSYLQQFQADVAWSDSVKFNATRSTPLAWCR